MARILGYRRLNCLQIVFLYIFKIKMPVSTCIAFYLGFSRYQRNFGPRLFWRVSGKGIEEMEKFCYIYKAERLSCGQNSCMHMGKILRTEMTEMFGKYLQNLAVIITVILSSVSSNIAVQAFLHMFLLGSIFPVMKDLLKFQTLVSPRYLKRNISVFWNVCQQIQQPKKICWLLRWELYFWNVLFLWNNICQFQWQLQKCFHTQLNLPLKMGKDRVVCFFLLACTPIIDPNCTRLYEPMHQLLLGQVPFLFNCVHLQRKIAKATFFRQRVCFVL